MNNGTLSVLKLYEQQTLERLQYQYLQIDAWLIYLNREKFSSISTAMWWAVATLTTVGYGDIFPITSIGKLLGSISAIFGIGLFALPAGLLASGFSDELEKAKTTYSTHPQQDRAYST